MDVQNQNTNILLFDGGFETFLVSRFNDEEVLYTFLRMCLVLIVFVFEEIAFETDDDNFTVSLLLIKHVLLM